MYKAVKRVFLCAAAAAAVFGAVSRAHANAPEEGSRSLPVIMYHSVVKDPSLAGEYVITTDELEADLRYLRGSGYTPVLCRDLPAFVEGTAELPEKPVVLTFDDGCYNNFYYALPLIERYGCKAVFAPVAEWAEQAAAEEAPSAVYSYMDAENLRTCALSGRVELACHSYALHDISKRRGVLRRNGETAQEYRRMLLTDLDRARRFLERVSGEPVVTLAYPYGFYDDTAEETAAELGFEVTLSCEERVNTVSRGDYSCLARLGRFNRASGRGAWTFMP